jgi:hypothetical protein
LVLTSQLPDGVSLSETDVRIEAHGRHTMKLTWKPEMLGKVRETLEFKVNNKQRVRVLFGGNAVKMAPKKVGLKEGERMKGKDVTFCVYVIF